MKMKLRFLGAAQNVTGSRHLLEADGIRLLVDCGLYQERQFLARNWDPFPVSPSSIDAVLLTHAHLDHCGLLPKLVREGFRGKIYCTQATAELAEIILLDSAKLQEEDAEHKRKRHERTGKKGPYPEVPLYTIQDALNCFPHFEPVEYGQIIDIAEGIEVSFWEAGHVLGSSTIRVSAGKGRRRKTVLFSGDIGRPDRPIIHDAGLPGHADYVVIESTYGDRIHHRTQEVKKQIAEVINSTQKRGGNIVVPSFALERSQDILYYLNELLMEDAIPHLMVFLDSPMAAQITEIFRRHPELFDKDMSRLIENHQSPFDLPGLKITATSDESKAINHIKGTVMIIAGAGMCTGGRIKHHLANNISRKESTIMFVGYQSIGTLGRLIADGIKNVRILGQKYKVKAHVVKIQGFSAHGDKNELLAWLEKLKKAPKQVFVVHGESKSALAFGKFVRQKTGWNTVVPEYNQTIELD